MRLRADMIASEKVPKETLNTSYSLGIVVNNICFFIYELSATKMDD